MHSPTHESLTPDEVPSCSDKYVRKSRNTKRGKICTLNCIKLMKNCEERNATVWELRPRHGPCLQSRHNITPCTNVTTYTNKIELLESLALLQTQTVFQILYFTSDRGATSESSSRVCFIVQPILTFTEHAVTTFHLNQCQYFMDVLVGSVCSRGKYLKFSKCRVFKKKKKKFST